MDKVTMGKIGEVEFQFNPKTGESAAVEYASPKIQGRETKLLHFSGGSGRSQPLKITLDDNFAKSQGYTESAIEKLESYRKKGENDAPPVILLNYGKDIYWVIVTQIEITTELRDSSNNRIQAEITLSIQEYVDEEYHRTRREQKGRRFLFISQGDTATFRSLAEQVYNNAELWQAISDSNPNIVLRMLGPIIPAGTRIEIPPWSTAKSYLNTPQTGLVKYD